MRSILEAETEVRAVTPPRHFHRMHARAGNVNLAMVIVISLIMFAVIVPVGLIITSNLQTVANGYNLGTTGNATRNTLFTNLFRGYDLVTVLPYILVAGGIIAAIAGWAFFGRTGMTEIEPFRIRAFQRWTPQNRAGNVNLAMVIVISLIMFAVIVPVGLIITSNLQTVANGYNLGTTGNATRNTLFTNLFRGYDLVTVLPYILVAGGIIAAIAGWAFFGRTG